MSFVRYAALVLAITLFSTCKSPTEPMPPEPENTPVPREVAGDDYVNLSDGLKYYDFEVGTGDQVKNGDLVTVHYHGWLTNNTLFDSSHLRNRPFSFQIGGGQVIQGWERGILGMRSEGQRQLVIPPNLAYGAGGQGSIPPNATLIFEVTLLSIN